MNRNHDNRLVRRATALLLCLAVLTGASSSEVRAQDAEQKTRTIEVRDGKVWVDGEAVHELDGDADRVIFRHGDENGMTVYDRYKFHDLFDSYGLQSGKRADFDVMSGNFARYFPDRSGKAPFVFEFNDDPLFGAISDGLPDAEVMRLEREARRLAERIRREDGDTAELEAELDETLERIFDLKSESRTERMERLQSQLNQLRERVEQRETDREAIIEQRKQELLGRHGRYEW